MNNVLSSLRRPSSLARFTTWEYLPWWLANIPVYGFYGWLALRARHLFFFSNVAPAIPLGGAMGESKHDILKLLPPSILPKTLFVAAEEPFDKVLDALQQAGIGFPAIAKPNVGERGFLIKKVADADDLRKHLERYPTDFIIQEFLNLPMEASVLFHRFPGESGTFGITSVCLKAFLSVRGDGVSTVRMLMAKDVRAAFQLQRFEQEFPEVLQQTPAEHEILLLEPIGNHARGTKFLNGNHLIDQQLVAAFKSVCKDIPGVLYGRFDLKCNSIESLKRGEFRVMELNGVFGEPAHVYDPNFGMWRAYRDLWRHWRLLYQLHLAQRRMGIEPVSHRKAWGIIRAYFKYKKQFGG